MRFGCASFFSWPPGARHTMANSGRMPVEVTAYVGQTRQRITQVIQELDRLRRGQDEDLNGLIVRLCEQEQVCLAAEFTGIARLVHDMSDCLRWGVCVQRPMTTGSVNALLDACQCILLHAEALEAGVYSLHPSCLQRNRACGTSRQSNTDDQTRLPRGLEPPPPSHWPRTAVCDNPLSAEE